MSGASGTTPKRCHNGGAGGLRRARATVPTRKQSDAPTVWQNPNSRLFARHGCRRVGSGGADN